MNLPPSYRFPLFAFLAACSTNSNGETEIALERSVDETLRCESDPEVCDSEAEISLDEVKVKAGAKK